MNDQPTKTLYHSELVKRSPLRITIKSGPIKSQYTGKPDFYVFSDNGQDRYYSVETEEIKNHLLEFVGDTVKLVASGSGRDGSAHLEVHPPDDFAPSQPAPAQPAHAKKVDNNAGQAGPAVQGTRQRAAQIANLLIIASKAAHYAADVIAANGGNPTNETIASMAMNIAIQLERENYHTELPHTSLDGGGL